MIALNLLLSFHYLVLFFIIIAAVISYQFLCQTVLNNATELKRNTDKFHFIPLVSVKCVNLKLFLLVN